MRHLKGTVIFGEGERVPALGSNLNEMCSYKLKHHLKTKSYYKVSFFFSFELDPFLYNARWAELERGTGEETQSKISSSHFFGKKSLLDSSKQVQCDFIHLISTGLIFIKIKSFSYNIIQQK